MSGGLILQNGKSIGAVTHVLANNPTGGYGTLAERVLAQSQAGWPSDPMPPVGFPAGGFL